MPAAGRKPKPEGQARNRNKPTHEWSEVENKPFEGSPELPKRRDGLAWSDRILKKWSVWSAMPHCSLWTPTDWEFAFDSLEIAAQFLEGNEKLAGELRNREKVLGTTHDYRRDLRIRYVEKLTEGKPSEDVVDINEFKSRVG